MAKTIRVGIVMEPDSAHRDIYLQSVAKVEEITSVAVADPTDPHRIGVAGHEQELHFRQARDTANDHRSDQHRVQRRLDRERQRHDVRQGLHADCALDQQPAGRRVLQQELIDSLGASALA